jgi:hypothetical protein
MGCRIETECVVACLLKARIVKPAETDVIRAPICKHGPCKTGSSTQARNKRAVGSVLSPTRAEDV